MMPRRYPEKFYCYRSHKWFHYDCCARTKLKIAQKFVIFVPNWISRTPKFKVLCIVYLLYILPALPDCALSNCLGPWVSLLAIFKYLRNCSSEFSTFLDEVKFPLGYRRGIARFLGENR